MSTAHIHKLEEYRGRRDQRLRRALALHAADASRAGVLRHLWQALSVVGAERAAAVWVDEYGPGIPHVYAILDLASDVPRRSFHLETLKLTWQAGVPGIVDLPDAERSGGFALSQPSRSSCVTSLGSDGMRAWFLVVDSTVPRTALDPTTVELLMFLSGECAGILLHRDLDEAAGDEARRFPGWAVLRDIDGAENDELLNRRVAGRFLVARAVRSLLDDDLAVETETLEEQVRGIRSEVRDDLTGDPERDAWDRILTAMEKGDWLDLCREVLSLGVLAEHQGHLRGAEELHESAFELARQVGAVHVAVDAARFLGRVTRRQARWDESLGWYGVARDILDAAEDEGRHALVLDGMAAVYIGRGAVPRAREMLNEAVECAVRSGDRLAISSVHHNLMTVEHTAGHLEEAVSHGWRAVQAAPDEATRLAALTALGGVFLEGRALGAAEDAFAIVAARTKLHYYRLHALEGYAHVAALRGDRAEYERRLERVGRAGFDEGSPEFRAEAFLQRGDGYLHLGDERAARALYEKGRTLSREHGVTEYLVRAEEALERLDRVAERDAFARDETPAAAPLAPLTELEEIRGGLGRIRREMAPAGSEL